MIEAGHMEEWPAQLTTRSLSVILVAHNDALGITDTVERLYKALVVTTDDFEINIFDDGSTDGTSDIARDLEKRFSAIRVICLETHMGPGHCFVSGCRQSKSNFVVYVPADNTWPYRSYVELFGNIGKADIIVSYLTNFAASMPFMRRLVSAAYTTALNVLFGFGLRYYNGLAIYPSSFIRSATLVSPGFGFQAEALIRALGVGYSFLEVSLPINEISAVKSRSVTLNNIVDAMKMMWWLSIQLLFSPVKSRTPRVASKPVRMGPAINDLDLNITQSRAVPLKSTRAFRVAITGASSGIGEALARALGEDGHRVFICARRKDRLEEIVRQIPSIRAIACDVTQEHQVAEFVTAIKAETEGLDVLINCAGSFGEIGPAISTDSDGWWDTIRTNVFGPYLTIKHCLPLLEHGVKARIINIAGGGAFSPFPNYSAYACSKAALVRLTECLALELRSRNIRVNAVSPGIVATDIHDATLKAGEERAGRSQFRRTQSIMTYNPKPDGFIACVRAMLSPAFDRMTGKTISANFDPWQTEAFLTYIDEITASDLYTLRRLNLFNLNEGYLRKELSKAWASFGSTN